MELANDCIMLLDSLTAFIIHECTSLLLGKVVRHLGFSELLPAFVAGEGVEVFC